MAGLGARTNNADRKFIAEASVDASVSSGVASGRLMQPFPGMPGAGGVMGGGGNTHLWVWALLALLIFGSLGVHFGLGRVRGSLEV